jgi:hypothetical protein
VKQGASFIHSGHAGFSFFYDCSEFRKREHSRATVASYRDFVFQEVGDFLYGFFKIGAGQLFDFLSPRGVAFNA